MFSRKIWGCHRGNLSGVVAFAEPVPEVLVQLGLEELPSDEKQRKPPDGGADTIPVATRAIYIYIYGEW